MNDLDANEETIIGKSCFYFEKFKRERNDLPKYVIILLPITIYNSI